MQVWLYQITQRTICQTNLSSACVLTHIHLKDNQVTLLAAKAILLHQMSVIYLAFTERH